MTDVMPVCIAIQQWADYIFGVASNQLDKKQRKKVCNRPLFGYNDLTQ